MRIGAHPGDRFARRQRIDRTRCPHRSGRPGRDGSRSRWHHVRMPAPAFARALLGRRSSGFPNIADSDSESSKALSNHIFAALGITAASSDEPQTLGRYLEEAVVAEIASTLPSMVPGRAWEIKRGRKISDFSEYEHLATIQRLVATHPTLSETGGDYLIKPDVTVAIRVSQTELRLHAAIPCKWTIRSDRVQNIRHEGVILTRHRRGRQPHIMVVTMEPLPSRLASIARGTGEVDAVYHVLFDELGAAVKAVAGTKEVHRWDELVGQKRIVPFARLLPDLAFNRRRPSGWTDSRPWWHQRFGVDLLGLQFERTGSSRIAVCQRRRRAEPR